MRPLTRHRAPAPRRGASAVPRRALVTGATEGIGRALALALATDGYAVTAVARTEERLRELTSLLGPGHDHLAADLSTPEGIRAVAAALEDAGHDADSGPYDLLVNNAGLARPGPFATTALDAQLPVLRLHCDAVTALSHAFLGTARPGAALVNVASTLGLTPQPGQALYSASKAFVVSFSQALWHEHRPRDVYVTALCPGPTATRPGLHADAPARLVLTPERVAAATLAALRRRHDPVVVPGRLTALVTAATRALPRRTALALLAGAPA
ncbi:SDR family NAD(P)-dependent oxidoreductase [Streptomyces sp. NPDC093225]|uniref:SDR family NAD(P)-dependent oxidoreductase n=1 Tax=Streptomyces sp. NPDC093225 TaxID=3366034 RepID=UPI0037F1B4DA